MDIERIWSSESQLHTLTGLTKNEAEEILPLFISEMQNLGHMKANAEGRPSKLSAKGVFLMAMMFLRHYLPHEALGAIFNIDDSNVKRWIDRSEKVLNEVLTKKNLSHLIAPNREKPSRKNLGDNGESILTELSNLFGAPKIP